MHELIIHMQFCCCVDDAARCGSEVVYGGEWDRVRQNDCTSTPVHKTFPDKFTDCRKMKQIKRETPRGIYLLLVQNLTSYSCSATPISYKRNEISRLSGLIIDI